MKSMVQYFRKESGEGRFTGEQLIAEGVKEAQTRLSKDFTVEEIEYLARELYEGYEYFDGEPVSYMWFADRIVRLVALKKQRGVPLTRRVYE